MLAIAIRNNADFGISASFDRVDGMSAKGFPAHVRSDFSLVYSLPGIEIVYSVLFFVFRREPLRFSVGCFLV